MDKLIWAVIIIVGAIILLNVAIIGGGSVLVKINPDLLTSFFPAPIDPTNCTYSIEGKQVTLKDGVAEEVIAPDSASKIVTQYFGNEVIDDFNGDGLRDVAFILTQNAGGSGTFYYATVAIANGKECLGTNAVLLGDRIAPQSTEFVKGQIIFNYTDRKPDEPMTATPSVGVSKYLRVGGTKLLSAASFGNPVKFIVGQEVAFEDDLTLSLKTINDSRCKPKVVCVWAGEISLIFSASYGNITGTKEVRLGTTMQKTVSLSGYTFSVVNADEASATITVDKAATATTMPTAAQPVLHSSSWQASLPLGDGKYTTTGPKAGYIYLCHVQAGGGGAQGNPAWIHGSTWNPSEKVSVQGAVAWPDAAYSMNLTSSTRTIVANGLPTNHTTGIFPIRSSDPAYQFDKNPNSILSQNFAVSLPANPVKASAPGCIYGQVGIMNNGIPIFNGFDAEYRDAVAHETQDANEGHPEKTGAYHYHGFEKDVAKNTAVSTVVGFAYDGFPITGGKLEDGTYLLTKDLDECHGITSAITLDGKQVSTYHYVLTQDFPYSVSCFKGKSYEPKPGGAQSTQGGQPSGVTQPPQEAVNACQGKYDGNPCSFSTPNGTVQGACHIPPGQSALTCVPN